MVAAAGAAPLTELAEAWVGGLLDAALKGTVLLSAAWLAARLLRSRPAAVRHLVWAAALLGLLLLPAATHVVPDWEVSPVPSLALDAGPEPHATGPAPEAGAVPGAGRGAGGAPAAPAGRPAHGTGASGSSPVALLDRISPVGAAAAVWLAGLLAVLGRALFGRLRIWWLGRSAHRVRSGRWLRLRDRLADRLDVRRPVRILRSPESTVPMTWGILRPKVLLPREADGWTPECRRNVLLHELAHVRRRDYLVRLAGRLAAAVYWFHPLAWLALRRLERAQEAACDDHVLRTGVRASDYAGQLVRVVRGLRAVRSGTAAGGSGNRAPEFLRRMRALLAADRPGRPASSGQRATVCAVAAACVAGLAALAPAPTDASGEADGTRSGPGGAVTTPVPVAAVRVPAPASLPASGDARDAGPDEPEGAGARGRPAEPEPGGAAAARAGGAATPVTRTDDRAGRTPAARSPDAGGDASGQRRASPDADGAPSSGAAPASAGPGRGRTVPDGEGGDAEPPAAPSPYGRLIPEDYGGLALAASGTETAGGAGADRDAGLPAWSALHGRPVPRRLLPLAADAGDGARADAGARGADAAGPAAAAGCPAGCSLPALRRRLAQRPDSTDRLALLRRLAQSSDARSAALLMKLSYRADRSTDRELAVQAISEMSAPVRDRYLFQVARANPWVAVRAEAIERLGATGGQRVVPWLVKLAFLDVNAQVQAFTVEVLARMEGGDATSGLLRIARSHPEDGVRDEAIRWLVQTGRSDALSRITDSA